MRGPFRRATPGESLSPPHESMLNVLGGGGSEEYSNSNTQEDETGRKSRHVMDADLKWEPVS